MRNVSNTTKYPTTPPDILKKEKKNNKNFKYDTKKKINLLSQLKMHQYNKNP